MHTIRDAIIRKLAAKNSGTSMGVKKAWLRRHRGGPSLSPSGHTLAERFGLTAGETSRIRRYLAGKQTSAEFSVLSETEQAAIDEARKAGHLVSHGDRLVTAMARAVAKRLGAANCSQLAAMSPSPMIGKFAGGKQQQRLLPVKTAANRKRDRKASVPAQAVQEVAKPGEAAKPAVLPQRHLLPPASKSRKLKKNRRPVKEGSGMKIRKRRSTTDPDTSELAEGTRHEMEHTSDPQVARRIAMDHLAEDPQYYSKLKKCFGE